MINFVQMDERTEKYELCYADDYIMSLSMRCDFIKINNYELFSAAKMLKIKIYIHSVLPVSPRVLRGK